MVENVDQRSEGIFSYKIHVHKPSSAGLSKYGLIGVRNCFIHYHKFIIKTAKVDLTIKAPFTTIVPFVARVDQDQAVQNMQPDLWSTLSTVGKH